MVRPYVRITDWLAAWSCRLATCSGFEKADLGSSETVDTESTRSDRLVFRSLMKSLMSLVGAVEEQTSPCTFDDDVLISLNLMLNLPASSGNCKVVCNVLQQC